MSRPRKRKLGRWLAAFVFILVRTLARAADDDDLDLFGKGLGLSLWDQSFTVRTGVGYDDNVLLNDSRVRGSPFVDSGLDATVFRLPVGPWEYFFLLTGDDYRYWRDLGVGNQDLWLGAAKIQRSFGDDWKAGFTFSYAYQAQVLDLLTSEGVPSATPTKVIGDTISLRPFVRRTLGSNYWVEFQAEGTRQIYDAPAFSFWRAGPKITLGRSYGYRSEVSVSYGAFDELFDTEPRAASDGSSLPGGHLAYWEQKTEALWQHHWDEQSVWTTATRISFDSVSDNGSGYFNYYRYGASEQLDFATHGWTVTASAGIQYYNYPYQTADDLELSKLYDTGFNVSLHVEKYLTKWLKLFADYEFEHTFSNDFVEEYAVNTVKGGLLWQF